MVSCRGNDMQETADNSTGANEAIDENVTQVSETISTARANFIFAWEKSALIRGWK